MPTARLDLHLLGLFRLLQGDQSVAGWDQARLQHLLAYLVLHRAAPLSRQLLASLVNTRAYGTDADAVIKYTNTYIEGYRVSGEMITCVKHFPGDGTEERDQHLVLGVNDLPPEEWDASFGPVYKNHIDNGVETFMSIVELYDPTARCDNGQVLHQRVPQQPGNPQAGR